MICKAALQNAILTHAVKLQKRLAGINVFYRLQMRGLLENHCTKPVKIEGIVIKGQTL